MNSKPHRQNSQFQLRYFLAGDCKTADGAWSLMYGQKIDMETKLRHSESQRLRRESKIALAQEIIDDPKATKGQILGAQADIAEQEADTPVWELNLQAAQMELADIENLMAELEPHRKYGHLPLLEATEAAQRDEWLEELKTRAENFLVTQGTIPHDHLNTMRCHPDFKTHLVPHISNLMVEMQNTLPVNILKHIAGLTMPQITYERKEPEVKEAQILNYSPRT